MIASNVAAVAANGIGATSSPDKALVTRAGNISALTTTNNATSSIRIYNDGATNLSGDSTDPGATTDANSAINSGKGGQAVTSTAPSGSFTLVSTDAVTQSKALQTDALTVVTVKDAGADITLNNSNNHANSYSIFACPSLPIGCPPISEPPFRLDTTFASPIESTSRIAVASA